MQSRDEPGGIFSQDNLEYLIRLLELEEELEHDGAELSVPEELKISREELRTPDSGTGGDSMRWS